MAMHARLKERQKLQNLADFRYELRRFLHFSEDRAAEAGLHPQQHQLLLQVSGAPSGAETTLSYAATRLGLRHHTVVELSKRCQDAGLIDREQDQNDRRCVQLRVTSKGQRLLRILSEDHARELNELAPRLIAALSMICGMEGQIATDPRSAVPAEGNCK